MGRHDFAPQRVYKSVTRLVERGRMDGTPPWYHVAESYPPSERLVRPALQSHRKAKGKASRMFMPVKIEYPEDRLRETFFGDHPWELARPRTMLEDDGKDYQNQHWSRMDVPGRPVDGESVVQRQAWLMQHDGLTEPEAYDKARKEFYRLREAQEIERRVAKEEAQYMGAHFGKSALDVGMELEDKEFEAWKEWAKNEVQTMRQIQGSMYTGLESEDSADAEDAEAIDDSADSGGEGKEKNTPLEALLPNKQ